METDKVEAAGLLGCRLKGLPLQNVERFEFEWRFEFGARRVLQVRCPWRLLSDGRIAFTDSDDGQQFGLPAPKDGEAEVRKIIGDSVIQKIALREVTGDLSIYFGERAILEVLNMSCGYESWEIGANDVRVIGLGGGDLAIYASAKE